MIPCEIMKDLLPTCAAGECSDATRKAVDEHVASCAACAKSLRAMTEPAVAAERAGDLIRNEELGKEMTFKTGFKKIQRRWLISILSVLLIIPLSGLVYLGYNETRGEGYAFSNLKGLSNVDNYMKSLKKGDFEALIKYYDFESMYFEIVNEQNTDYPYLPNYLLVEIGGENYYVDMARNQSEFEPYAEHGNDADLWAQVIIENAKAGKENPIPEQAFKDAAKIAGEMLGEEIIAIDFMSDTPDSPYTYVPYLASNGNSYYRPTQYGRLSELNWIYLDYIPKAIYEFSKQENKQKTEANRETIESYRALGSKRYTAMAKERYIAELKEKYAQGMKVESYTIGNPYRRSEDWSPTDPYEQTKEYWFVDVEVLFSKNGSEEFNQVFTFRMDGDKLAVQGAFASVTVYSTGSMSVYSYSTSPSPYVLDDDPNHYLIDMEMGWQVITYPADFSEES